MNARVQDLLRRMTLQEKIGQMGQINSWVLLGDPATPWDWPGTPGVGFNMALVDRVFGQDKIGSVLSGGGAWPPVPPYANDGRGWAQFTNQVQAFALDASRNRLGIPLLYGIDAVHGHNTLSDATDFPHQIGLGSSFDPGLVQQLGDSTGHAVDATGIHWSFSPDTDTERDLRWGRTYEPFGEDPLLTGTMAADFVRGIQGPQLRNRVAATSKHFTGYSAPDSGLDRTDATISEAELQAIHVPPFGRAIDAGTATVMINSSTVNGVPAHASHRLVTDVLRDQLGFGGMVISDWEDIQNLVLKYRVADTMEDAIADAVNAGVDMSMIPLIPDNSFPSPDPVNHPDFGFFENAIAAVHDGKIPMWRINQAVSRILALKFQLGLFEHPYADPNAANAVVEDPAQRTLARQAARETLVLLKNDGTLPFGNGVDRVLLTGPNSDSAINQLGGWTVNWQGAIGLPASIPVPEATTLREGLDAASAARGVDLVWRQGVPVGDTTNRTAPADNPQPPVPPDPVNDPNNPDVAAAIQEAVQAAANVDVVVVAVGESPYSETPGDDLTPELSPSQARLVDELKGTGKPVVLVDIAGRPQVMNTQLDETNAALMAFWPGSEGGSAIADALFGAYNPAGRLSVSWPKSIGQFPLAYDEPGPYDPRYPFGFGLSYSQFQLSDLRAPDSVGKHGSFRFSVDLLDRGPLPGDQVVLAFVKRLDGPSGFAPRGQLVAFERVHLGVGESDKVKLSFDISQLADKPATDRPNVKPGRYRLSVGGLSETFRVH